MAPKIPAPLAQLLGLTELSRLYRQFKDAAGEVHFFDRALKTLRVTVDVDAETLQHIPEAGPTIIVANHPFGALDGLVVGSLAVRRHPNVRILANQWLHRIPELQPWLLGLDVFGDRANKFSNASVLKSAVEHLKRDGLLVVFPSGIVSHWQPGRPGIVDPPWNRLVALLARKTRATVVPVYFGGRNSWFFQLVGLMHPALRTALLPRELLRRRASQVKVRVGHAVSGNAIAAFADDTALTAWLRLRTYDLSCHNDSETVGSSRKLVGLVESVPASAIAEEISRIPSEALLVSQGPFRVYSVPATAIPRTLIEIGRLRELTFREVGEGTGTALDIDRFDVSYRHLFVFDESERRIVGGYRLGYCDELLRAQGPSGLYTNTLFQYDGNFVRQLSNTIELGRSFVRSDYQRSPLALAMLWRGIGELLVRNPRYDRLMGPVSISGSYGNAARRLMVSFLENLEHEVVHERAVRGRRPPRERLPEAERAHILPAGRNLRRLGRLVSDLDGQRRGIPVLLERYLELGGEVLALNVDPQFGHCLDALIVVDVPRAPESMLRRFLGAEGLNKYLSARSERVGLSA
jgi:putative hemolysin